MRSFLTALLLAPLAVWAQSASVSVSTSFLVTNVLTVSNGNRVFATISSAIPITITAAAASSSATGSAAASGSGNGTTAATTGSTNGTTAASTSTSSTSSSPLPTAVASNVNGGGSALNGGAPTPGASGAGGIYGPDDGYHVSGAVRAAAAVAMAGLAAGAGALLVLL
ncbi:hypothetical protein PENSPDRAFT_684728 [Peniophora sp. CONT]|nr:hypothetical protein PENSPDRAFT_684728 [Peniophora sp. CONT]